MSILEDKDVFPDKAIDELALRKIGTKYLISFKTLRIRTYLVLEIHCHIAKNISQHTAHQYHFEIVLYANIPMHFPFHVRYLHELQILIAREM